MGKGTKLILTVFGVFGAVVFFSTLSPRGKNIFGPGSLPVSLPKINVGMSGVTPTAAVVPTAGTLTTQIIFNGTSFVPNPASVAVNSKVTFVNNSSRAFWPKSGAFDAGTLIPENGTFETTFTKAGTYDYVDQVDTSIAGNIVVNP